ncbi:MAG: methyltransferase domain-containing protein [Luteimonas sp.]
MSDASGFEYRDNAVHFDAQERMGHLTAYYRWVLDLFGEDIPFPAADAGAGSGHFAALLRERGAPLLLLEGGKDNLKTLAARFGGDPDIEIVDCDLNASQDVLASHGVRAIFSLDVLEHLPDDQSVLRQFQAALPHGGRIYIKVPSLPALYGPVDEASGHYRRYTTRMLRASVETAGFRVDRCRYMNLAGVAPYFVKSRILKKQENFSRTFSPQSIARIERTMPWIRRIDGLTGAPLGMSAICIATKV